MVILTNEIVTQKDVCVSVEKHLQGQITQGKDLGNINLETTSGAVFFIVLPTDLIETAGRHIDQVKWVHVSAQENVLTGQLSNLILLEFKQDPCFDEAEFNRMVDIGTQAWAN